ncbi:hypothetical protein TrLO_g5766 [Triparma laevis f. longispina]|uniref:EF-hand domain-containing protein n=1 Tax=Triparma laevis f. longispina TaxID=1714387 RepID=A0A9W7KUC3_9STRA|nr:hypothetical protein TrLO_g5766 [Triparma laevis f. longispina]
MSAPSPPPTSSILHPQNPPSTSPTSLPTDVIVDEFTSGTAFATPHSREVIDRFTTPQWTPGLPGLISPDFVNVESPFLNENKVNGVNIGDNINDNIETNNTPVNPIISSSLKSLLSLEKEMLIKEQTLVEIALQKQLEAEASAQAEIKSIKLKNASIKAALNHSLTRSPELKNIKLKGEEELKRIMEKEVKVKRENERLEGEIEIMKLDIEREHTLYLEEQDKASKAKEQATLRASELEAEKAELAQQKEAFEGQKKQEAEIALELENISRMKAAELEKIRLHNVKLLSNSLKLQCFSRQYLARQRVKARIWEVAIEMHVRDEDKKEVEKLRLEQFKRWEQEQIERDLNYVARKIVRNIMQRNDGSLSSLRETTLCLKRFPLDLALQADGLYFLHKVALKHASACQFLLDEGVASILQKAGEDFDDEGIRESCEGIQGLLEVADDLKRVMPEAFVEDFKRRKKKEGRIPTQSEFWETAVKREKIIDEEIMEEERTLREDSFAAFESSVESPNHPSTLEPFPNYSVSPENSSFMRSIFEDREKPKFDLSQRMKTPPIMPPRLQDGDIQEMKKSVKYQLMVEEEKKDSFEVYPSGAFTHTPYAIPLSKRSKKKKRPASDKKKKKKIQQQQHVAAASADEEESRSRLEVSPQQPQSNFPEPSITSVLTDPRVECSPEPDPSRPHTASGVTRQRPDPISRRDSSNNEVLYYPEGEVMIVADEHPRPDSISRRDSANNEVFYSEEGGVMIVADEYPKSDPIRRRDSAKNEVLYHSSGEVMIVAEDHGSIATVASKDLDPSPRTPTPLSQTSGDIAFFDNNSKISPPFSIPNSRPTTSPYQNFRTAEETRSAAAGSRFSQDFKPWGNDGLSRQGPTNFDLQDEGLGLQQPERNIVTTPKPQKSRTLKSKKRPKRVPSPKPPSTPPRITLEEFRDKPPISPRVAPGPIAETLHKHSTVQKIFAAAAPPRQIVKNRYMGSIGANVPPGSPSAKNETAKKGGLGRRHSIRDMAAIFKILDDSNVGLIPAAKFSSALLAMSSLSVEKTEVERMLNDFGVDMSKDHIDYNEFLSTGTVLRVKKHTLNSTAVPFTPWKNQLVRPPPERSAHINVMWEKHVKWYQKRKEHAVLWLLKRAVAAQSYNKRQVKVRDFLIHQGKQALAWSELQLNAKIQLQHFTKQMRDAKDLRQLVTKARKHGIKQLQAHRGLKRMVRHDVIARLIASHDQRNYNKIYYLGFKNKIAFEYLLEVGRHSVRHYLQQQEHVIWLHQFAERAKVHYIKCVENYEWLDGRSDRALKTWAKKDFECAKLVRTGNKYTRVWEHQKRALRDTHEWGGKAIVHCKRVDEAIYYLASRGEVALKYEERHNEAATFLLDWGYRAGHHAVVQEDSRAWLKARVQEVQAIKRRQDEAQNGLLNAGKHAKRHCNSCDKAKSFLATRVELSRQRQVRQAEARLDLNMFTDDARAVLHKQALVQNCPGLIKETEKKIKVEDKEKDKARKGMEAQERFREEMKDAFKFFDTDDSGEIDKVEFRHLLSSGHLIHVPTDEIDDSYSQIDKDGSGGVDFDEFFAWFQYEFSHDKQHGKMENFRVSKVIPLKQRATRLLLPKFVEGGLEDDFGTKVAAPGQGVMTVDGIDDRWWLDEVEKQKEPYSHYLKRKEGIRILEEKRNQKVVDDAEEAARQKELNMTHEEKVARRKEKDADKAKKLAQMKKRLSMKRHMNIAQQEIEKAHELEELEEEGGGEGGGEEREDAKNEEL